MPNLRQAIAVCLAPLFVGVANTEEAPRGMTRFNVECPAPRLCKTLQASYLGCLKGLKHSCDTFVDAYGQATPKYDCQRSFDATPTANYIVPAVWVCGAQEHEDYANLLARLKTSNAQRLFASPDFRQTLDGALASEF